MKQGFGLKLGLVNLLYLLGFSGCLRLDLTSVAWFQTDAQTLLYYCILIGNGVIGPEEERSLNLWSWLLSWATSVLSHLRLILGLALFLLLVYIRSVQFSFFG